MKKAIVPLGIILLVIFGVFMYLNRFTLFHVSDVNGYVFDTNNIATNLSAGLTENSEKVTFEKVKVNDSIYQSGKKYYIGEETKINVNLDYPIISEDTSSVYILNDTGKYIDENSEVISDGKDVSEIFSYHSYYINRMFKKYLGITLHKYILKAKISRSVDYLTTTNMAINEIAYKCGFFDTSHYSRNFKKITFFH